MERIPLGQHFGEGFPILVAARRAGNDLDGCLGISIRCFAAAVEDLKVVDGPETSIEMFVGKELHIDAMLVEQILQAEPPETRQTLTDVRLQLLIAVVFLVVTAVHGPMTIGNDPRTLGSILWQIGFGQIALQPLELLGQQLHAVIEEIVDLRGEGHKVHGAHVEAVPQTVSLTGHIEALAIIGEVAAGRKRVGSSRNRDLNWITIEILTTSPHDYPDRPCRAHRRPLSRSDA